MEQYVWHYKTKGLKHEDEKEITIYDKNNGDVFKQQ
jgi:hypothetical protein